MSEVGEVRISASAEGWPERGREVGMSLSEARAFLEDPENAEVVRLALAEVCRERPDWWVRFLRREVRLQGGRPERVFGHVG